ncbi:MAG: 50S ribosomal protein L30 [Nanoarchaeota archaeon]|jgi:large subunit ribosomal protein L30|nr:50S ribosomal protein L30 [Nanoarchaeota archaeon]|tara:strand:- start:21728 stop:22204 length:477 start_codon:yes stop_codon:yes gene_type:complete
MEKKKIAVIRIRGSLGLKREIRDTFKLLRLYKKNYAIIIDNTPQYIGMLTKVKDYVTWGEISPETFQSLLEKRGRLAGKKRITPEYLKKKGNSDFDIFTKEFFESKKSLKDVPGLKFFFRLSPPRKGFERKGIKVPFSLGGVLGYRKEKINDLLNRMI